MHDTVNRLNCNVECGVEGALELIKYILRTEKMIGAKCVKVFIKFIFTNGLWKVMS